MKAFNKGNRFGGLKKFDYFSYWEKRDVKVRDKLMEREHIFNGWIKPDSSVLDVAVGNSRLPQVLKDKKCVVTVMDISEKVIEAQSRVGINGEVNDLTEQKDFAGFYDYIIASEVLEHIQFPELAIKKLIPHGKHLIFSIPNSAFYKFRLDLLLGRFFKQWAVHPAEHVRFWSHLDFLEWLESLGLRVVKFKASNGLDIGKFKFYNFLPNLFGHQICYFCEVNS